MKRGLRLASKKRQKTEQTPAKPRATRTTRYESAPQAAPDKAVGAADDDPDELDEAATGWQQTTVKMAGLTKLITFGVWALILAGPLLAFFAIAVAGSSRAAPTATASRTEAQPSATGPAGFAELYLAAYLEAGEGTEDDLLPYYPESVNLANDPGSRTATSVVTVAAHQVSPGYWAVTVAARISAKNKNGKTIDQGLHYFRVGVQVSGTPEAGGTARPAATVAPTGSTKPSATAKPSGSSTPAEADTPPALYSATSLPAEVNAPASATHGDLAYGPARGVKGNEAVTDTVSRFFAAYLTGQGELDRYVSPGLEVAAIVPAPYKSTLVTGLQVDQGEAGSDNEDDTVPVDGTRRQVLVSVSATTDGQDYLLTYALTLSSRDGRWEVAAVDAAPVLAPGQTGPVADGASPAPSPSADASTDAVED